LINNVLFDPLDSLRGLQRKGLGCVVVGPAKLMLPFAQGIESNPQGQMTPGWFRRDQVLKQAREHGWNLGKKRSPPALPQATAGAGTKNHHQEGDALPDDHVQQAITSSGCCA
jgi:hypothetical protein